MQLTPVRAICYGQWGQYGRCMVHTLVGTAGVWFIRTGKSYHTVV